MIYKKYVHKIFLVSIFLKALNGILEIIGGVLLFTVTSQAIIHTVVLLTQGELIEDPNDLIANFLLKSAHSLTLKDQYFGGLFLLSHGIIKLVLIIYLFKRKLWAYPSAIGVFGVFILYQMYLYFLSHSVWMACLTVFDLFVISVTYLEYRRLKLFNRCH